MYRRQLLAILPAMFLAPALARAAEKEEKKKGGGLTFIQVQTMTANYRRRSGAMGVLTVETGVDIPDDGLHKLAMLSLPRLRSAYASCLGTYAAQIGGGLTPNADYMAVQMQRITDQTLGKPGAKFLLGTILMN